MEKKSQNDMYLKNNAKDLKKLYTGILYKRYEWKKVKIFNYTMGN